MFRDLGLKIEIFLSIKLFGMFQKKYCHMWDMKLREISCLADDLTVSDHTVQFIVGDIKYEVWISNRWYSYGYLWQVNDKSISRLMRNKRPSIAMMIKLDRLVKAHKDII